MPAAVEPGVVASVCGYVADVFGCGPEQVGSVTRFEAGNRHDVYRVACPDSRGGVRDVVVRTAYSAEPHELATAAWESQVMAALGGVGAPLLYDYRPSSRWFPTPTMCMEFVVGDSLGLSDALPDDVERLGSVLAGIHGLPLGDLIDGSRTRGVLAYAEERYASIISTLAWVRAPLPSEVQARILRAADSVQAGWPSARSSAAFARQEPLVLLHGDIADGNLLWSQGPVLIDWEYARLGDPADDIANLLQQNQLPPSLREAFWRGYADGARTAAESVSDRLAWWEPLTLLGSTLWWAERWVRRADADATGSSDRDAPRQPGYYRDEAISRLSRLESLLDVVSHS